MICPNCGHVTIPMGVRADCPGRNGGWLCTLDADHEGPHAAHGGNPEVPIGWWIDGGPFNKLPKGDE